MRVHRMRRTGRRVSPIGIGRMGSGGVPVQTLFLDHFTGTNGTDLTAHTPDVGTATWSAAVGANTIQSNRSFTTAANSFYVVDVGQSDVTLTAVMQVDTGSQTSGLVLRQTNTSNFWILAYNQGNTTIDLSEVNAGSPTARLQGAASDLSLNADFTVSVVLSGQTITVSVNGTSRGSYTSASFNATATKFGIRRTTGSVTVDDFTITKP